MSVGPLSDSEQRLFFELLRRVCENHVDQWLMMRMDTSDGTPFFIDISLAPRSGDPDLYVSVAPDSRLGDHWRIGAEMERLQRQDQGGGQSGDQS